ncbi:dolichyl-diphosphooligosaccharide--protein glycosyltransferase subunit 2 [Eurytemora carolleeae]|uniref:dolichyl-diphosphooligosaccharide--protein glycosyltransferase subunit 2 n=1 Tax=Eurytemora carolleeae TaxID=1294199 RepID=UPI000C7611CA|nr:dolichyl-diphosphooligosaccharide--protein glycosyltransferase subunit 2 [Eurytemora carolleeae]|eukprot:XP_023341820.1 dolichyl-diphosphooligosaccharide--protein glycosyltransferase subunit 2-like [Eurytemora affinis]
MKLIILMTLAMTGQAISPSSHLTQADRNRLKAVFLQNSNPASDITSVYYSVLGLKLLGEAAPNKGELCSAAAKLADDSSVENLQAASGTGAALGCPIKFGAKASEVLKTSLGEGSTTATIYFASKALTSAGGKLEKGVAKALTDALKKDDSLLSLGLAFHVAALLEGDQSAVFDRIEDAVVQADEVDGNLLQFEGGLSVTSIVLTGAANLAAKTKKALPLTGDQAVKFANYLLSRKSVQQPKGGLHLLEGIESMVGSAQFTPLSISLASSISVNSEEPNLILSVTDLKGGDVGDLKVTLDSATWAQDDSILASAKELKKVGAGYQLDFMSLKPVSGFYELTVSAVPAKGSGKFVGNTGVKIAVKVLTKISVQNAEIKITDGDQSTAGRSFKAVYPNKEGKKVSVDYKEKLQFSFNIVNSENKKITVHQAFVKISSASSAAEIVYVAEADSSKVYKFELDLGAENSEFKTGDYNLALILGDAAVSNPISWNIADLEFTLPESGDTEESGPYQTKPEIKHLFREPETRPPPAVSSMFTLLCLSPVLILLGLWFKLGVNIGNFPFSIASLGFHTGLGSIFLLYVYFWMELDMFQTARYLAILAIPTFLCGNSLLAAIAKKTK